MEIHVLYELFVAKPAARPGVSPGRLPGFRVRIASQVPKRGSLRVAPSKAPERGEMLKPLEAVE